MGLEALVYSNRDKFTGFENSDALKVDEDTGEVYFTDEEMSRGYEGHNFVTVSKRLGNAEMIAALLGEVLPVAGKDSVLATKVLYSGSHSGDFIPANQLGVLESEVKRVRGEKGDSMSPDLKRFLEDVTELINAALEEKNPIVFV